MPPLAAATHWPASDEEGAAGGDGEEESEEDEYEGFDGAPHVVTQSEEFVPRLPVDKSSGLYENDGARGEAGPVRAAPITVPTAPAGLGTTSLESMSRLQLVAAARRLGLAYGPIADDVLALRALVADAGGHTSGGAAEPPSAPAWDQRGAPKAEALARLAGSPAGTFVLRSSSLDGFVVLSIQRASGTPWNGLVAVASDGLRVTRRGEGKQPFTMAYATVELLLRALAAEPDVYDFFGLPGALRLDVQTLDGTAEC